MIEMHMLVQLVAIADCGTMSKAAEQLHLSQPALSRTMSKLEDILQVKLFDRRKNKIEFNDNGLLAVKYARKVLADTDMLVEQVRAFDESSRTISVISCAPAPLWVLEPALSELYPKMKVSSKMKYHDNFISELTENNCDLLIIPHQTDDPEIICHKFFDEQLFLSVLPDHPLAKRAEISLSDLDGETMLLYSDLGFWHEMHRTKTPNTKYIMQKEYDAMNELIIASALPSFISNITMKLYRNDIQNSGRVAVPIRDDETKASFYCCWKKSDHKRFKALEKYFVNLND